MPLCPGAEPCELSPTHVGMKTSVVFAGLVQQPCCWELRETSLSYSEDSIFQQPSCSSGSYISSAHPVMFPRLWCRGYVTDVPFWSGYPKVYYFLEFYQVSNSLNLFQKDFFLLFVFDLMKCESHTYLWVQGWVFRRWLETALLWQYVSGRLSSRASNFFIYRFSARFTVPGMSSLQLSRFWVELESCWLPQDTRAAIHQ